MYHHGQPPYSESSTVYWLVSFSGSVPGLIAHGLGIFSCFLSSILPREGGTIVLACSGGPTLQHFICIVWCCAKTCFLLEVAKERRSLHSVFHNILEVQLPAGRIHAIEELFLIPWRFSSLLVGYAPLKNYSNNGETGLVLPYCSCVTTKLKCLSKENNKFVISEKLCCNEIVLMHKTSSQKSEVVLYHG